MNNNINIMNQNDNEKNLKGNLIQAEDLFYYIKKPKKLMTFINSDNQKFNVMIPIFVTKSDLYSIALKYAFLKYTNIILSYSNCLLKKDNSSIEEIPNGSIINIIEERNIPYNKFKKCDDFKKNINAFIKRANFPDRTLYLS